MHSSAQARLMHGSIQPAVEKHVMTGVQGCAAAHLQEEILRCSVRRSVLLLLGDSAAA
jgi:hypothetical protein